MVNSLSFSSVEERKTFNLVVLGSSPVDHTHNQIKII